jgi:hypothetical protein
MREWNPLAGCFLVADALDVGEWDTIDIGGAAECARQAKVILPDAVDLEGVQILAQCDGASDSRQGLVEVDGEPLNWTIAPVCCLVTRVHSSVGTGRLNPGCTARPPRVAKSDKTPQATQNKQRAESPAIACSSSVSFRA